MLIDDLGGFFGAFVYSFLLDCRRYGRLLLLNYSLSKDHILRHYLRLLRRLLTQLLTRRRFEPVLHRRHR